MPELELDPAARDLLDRLRRTHPENAAALATVIDRSPHLIRQINAAVANSHLEKFEVLADDHPQRKAGYDPGDRSVTLSQSSLANKGETAFILGHEVQHAINWPETSRAERLFEEDVKVVARRDGDHDYTQAMSDALDVNRRDEASANIAGWNALVEQVRLDDPDATLDQIAEAFPRGAEDVVETGDGPAVVRSNLTLDNDLTLDPRNPDNLEGMGQNYFDKPSTETGAESPGVSENANYYGARLAGTAARAHREHNGRASPSPDPHALDRRSQEPPLRLDMQRLGLDPDAMHAHGIDLGEGPVPGAPPRPMPYLDTSTDPPTAGQFRHTMHEASQTKPTPTSRVDVSQALPASAAPGSSAKPEQAADRTHRLGGTGAARPPEIGKSGGERTGR
jgi:hypothetical protein